MPNKKGNRQTSVFFQICNSSINLSFREVMDRRQKEKGNTCVRNDKKRREKRDNR